MQNTTNKRIYRLWSPVYDRVFGPIFARARQHAIAQLDLQPGAHVLVPGVGTGLDLPLLPEGLRVTGYDLSAAMLAQARGKTPGRRVALLQMDAGHVALADASVDALLFMLVLSVVPDGAAAFRAAWRTLKPGGRAVIFDKFLPEERTLTLPRRLIGTVIRALGTDPNRKLGAILAGVPDLTITHQEASLLRGQYRIVVLHKTR